MIDYIKNHKKKFLTITGIVCAVALSALSVGIIFGTVTNHRSSDADNDNYAESKHYAASIDASEVVEYIRAVTYTELDKLNDEYKINLTVPVYMRYLQYQQNATISRMNLHIW